MEIYITAKKPRTIWAVTPIPKPSWILQAYRLTKTYHKRLSGDTERVITETFAYDSQNRLLVHKHQVDNNPEEILEQNT